MAALTIGLASCGSETELETGGEGLEGTIEIDGSSSVFLITEAVAEEFQAQHPDVRVTVGVSGTGGGFEKFCNGETAISEASRPIKESEIVACEEAGISFVELPVAYDAIAVVANSENDWAECLTVEELQKIWAPGAQGTFDNWNQVRAEFPDQPLSLYGPGTDSGTFDYFTDAIIGEEGASRGDYTASEDDNVLVQGVANDTGGLGYFGLAYLEENQDILKAIKVDNQDPSDGEGCIAPAAATVDDGTYQPLARPLFIYISTQAAERPEVQEFVQFYLSPTNAESLVAEVGYVPLSTDLYDQIASRFENRATGSIFGGGSTVGVNLKEEYSK
jgi:phosphate transport system substrate-binding protein